jgi:hypothetical protein
LTFDIAVLQPHAAIRAATKIAAMNFRIQFTPLFSDPNEFFPAAVEPRTAKYNTIRLPEVKDIIYPVCPRRRAGGRKEITKAQMRKEEIAQNG